MLKSQSNSEQFQTRSGNHSTKGSRKGFDLLGGGEDPTKVLTIEERRDSLKLRMLSIEYLMGSTADKGLRKKLGAEKFELQQQMSALRVKRKSEKPESIPGAFIDICRERMSKHQFRCIMDEANEIVRGNIAHNKTLHREIEG
jgi:hypothetical protein